MIYKKTVFGNGTRIISEALPHAKSVSVGIWVNAGSRDEHDRDSGIFHLIEHMLFKGTESRSAMQIAKDLDTMGGFSNAFTGKEQTCFHARVLAKHLPSLSELLSDIFINPAFAESDLELEKGVVLQEISMMEDTPEEYVTVLFDERFWKNDPLGGPILGTRGSVSSITREGILEYRSQFYTPRRVVMAAAGNVDHNRLVEQFRPFFEPLSDQDSSSTARPTPKTTPEVFSYEKELEQVHLCLGAQASPLSGEGRFAESIFNTILGGNMSSRLFQEIREKRGLAYSLYSHTSGYMDMGLIRIYAATDKAEVNKVLGLIHQQIKGIQGGDLTADEVRMAKDYLIGGILLAAESLDNLMTRLARYEFIFERYISHEELIGELEKVSLDEVVGVARRIFSAGKVSLTLLGPVDEDKIAQDPLNYEVN